VYPEVGVYVSLNEATGQCYVNYNSMETYENVS